MSAPAPALAKAQPRRIVVVRLGDVAAGVAAISVIFGVLLLLFPVSFPAMVAHVRHNGQLMPIMMAFALLFDTCLYLRVAQRLSAKPGIVGAACLGALPILVVCGVSFLMQGAVSHTLAADLPHLQARVEEEILAHTYLGLASAIFLPFLAIRLLQQFRATDF